jgi:hypothetical protein
VSGETRMTAREFLRDLIPTLTHVNLACVAVVAAIDVMAAVVMGSAGLSGWFALTTAAGSLALEAALVWWLLGIGRVQRWIKDGRWTA